MKMTYYFKDTKVTIEQPDSSDGAQLNELVDRITNKPNTVFVEVESNDFRFEGTQAELNDYMNQLKAKALGLSDN